MSPVVSCDRFNVIVVSNYDLKDHMFHCIRSLKFEKIEILFVCMEIFHNF